MTNYEIKFELYQRGIKLALRFCKVNKLDPPMFMTYRDLMRHDEEVFDAAADYFTMQAIRFAKRVMPNAALVGANTGLYKDNIIFVNVDATAWPVAVPGNRRWSWPCWKTDRTAVGVVAHELGHYIMDVSTFSTPDLGEQWRALLQQHRQRLTSYEPTPGEAMAETLRLYILNPNLLNRAMPHRFLFVRDQLHLNRSEYRKWKVVLGQNEHYVAAGERWIGKR